MCGIFGYFNYMGDGKSILQRMARQQIHRGPDSEGSFIDGAFGFGIRRLSIIDLVTGDQPICNEDKTIWVVCNGEIYNYLELNETLKKKGHVFHTNSDVECIVHLYEEYGIKAVEELNGMYGLALYDKRLKKLFLVRDRLGIKPLYYSSGNGVLLFSSELRSILATGLVDSSFDWNAISYFLDQLYIPTPFSPFRAIKKIKPGCIMEVTGEGSPFVEEKPYWDIKNVPGDTTDLSENEAVERLTFLLNDSSKIQLRADVPICVFLSGGIDSSAVVAFASLHVSKPLRTYHVYFDGATQKLDEREQARMVAQRYGTDHSEVRVGRDDFKRLIPRIIWHLEEPFGDLATVPTFIISEMARKDAKVCLNGSGGDELFAGYPHHDQPFSVRRAIAGALEIAGMADHVRTAFGKYVSPWSKLFPEYRDIRHRQRPEDKGKTFPGDKRNRLMARDIDGYLQSNVLFLLDKIAMAVSLEGRVPLLDHRFVETAAHLSSRMKIQNGERKHIFKKILEPYLPGEVLYRKKEGFGAPLTDWLDDETTGILRKIVKSGLLKKEKMMRLPERSIDSLAGWDLWKIACLDLWAGILAKPCDCPRNNTLMDYM
ncbi:Asparagine synthetase [glutamine-hydrolyzing] (EC [Olavius algarvensis associated proteobacterium Delta 3]|nr:Asparagine synthetase [glutamine-hydrolyzing] (EC [Olavius algarvensis associated proteobacterium Delta 3]